MSFYAFFRDKGYPLNQALLSLDNDTILVCDNIEPPFACLQKSKIFPLKNWNKNEFGANLLVPNDAEYCLEEWYGSDWRTPYLKGWKGFVCYNEWTESRITTFKLLAFLWFCIIIIKFIHEKRNNMRMSTVNRSEMEHLIMNVDESPKNKYR